VPSNDLIPSLLTLSDVMGTGWFAAPDTTRVTSEFVASRKCMGGTENERTSRRTYRAFSFCWSLIAGSDEYSESVDILDNQDHAKRLAAVKPRVCSILHRVRTGSATVSC